MKLSKYHRSSGESSKNEKAVAGTQIKFTNDFKEVFSDPARPCFLFSAESQGLAAAHRPLRLWWFLCLPALCDCHCKTRSISSSLISSSTFRLHLSKLEATVNKYSSLCLVPSSQVPLLSRAPLYRHVLPSVPCYISPNYYYHY